MFEAKVITTETATVAYVTMRGPYAQIPETMGRLYGWIGQHGLTPVGMPEGVYFTDPAEVPEAEALWEVRAPVSGDPAETEPDESGIGVKRIEPVTAASTMYKGPYNDIAPTYEALVGWIAENGYEISGPPSELYYSDAEKVPPSEYLTEVRIPIAGG